MKIALCILLVSVLAVCAAAADVSGKWSGPFNHSDADGQTHEASAFLVIKQSGTELTGTVGPDEGQQWPIENGKVDGARVTAEVHAPDGTVIKLDMELVGDHLKGAVQATHDGESRKGTIDLTRVK